MTVARLTALAAAPVEPRQRFNSQDAHIVDGLEKPRGPLNQGGLDRIFAAPVEAAFNSFLNLLRFAEHAAVYESGKGPKRPR